MKSRQLVASQLQYQTHRMKNQSLSTIPQRQVDLALDSSNNQNSNTKQNDNRTLFHIKVVTIILLLLLIAQISIYYIVTEISEKQNEQNQFAINQLKKQAQKHHPQLNLNNFTDLNQLQIKLANINQKIKQFQLWTEFQNKSDRTLEELTQRSQLLHSLNSQLAQIEKMRMAKQETTFEYLDQESSQYRFIFPKKIWLYDQLKEGYFQKMNELYQANIQRVGKNNAFQFQRINKYNFFSFVNRARYSSMLKTFQALKKRISDGKNEQFSQDNYSQIERQMVMLLVLQANGGIMVSKYLAFIQNFDWLQQISKNIFINKGTNGVLPRVFGFYNMSRSSTRIQQKGRTKQNRFKFVVKYPGIIPYFVVAVKGSDFIHDLTNQLFEMLQSPLDYINNTQNLRKGSNLQHLYFLSQRRIFDQFFQLGTMMTLLRKQKRMSIKNGQYNLLGMDQYGLVTMNANYGPEKTTFYFQNNQGKKILQHLTKFDIKQFQLQIGKTRYISKLPSYYELNDYVNNLTIYKEFMIKNSYFHLHFYPDSKQKFVQDRVQKPKVDRLAKPWSELPKIVWIYWHSGLDSSNIIYQLCADNLERYGEQSGFQVIFVRDTNLQDYLDADTIDRIEYAVNHQAGIVKSKYINYDLIRLALVAKHGGVYMDLSYIMLQNLDWLVNIPKYPSNLIFNRYGQKPSSFMFFHPHYGSPFMWKVNPQVNSKIAWQLGYENNFIAAQKGSQLIKDWFDQLLKAIQTPYEQLMKEFIRCNVYHHRWTTFNDIYLLSMDIVKYILGRKQKELQQSKSKQYKDACDYYKLWSMNGYMGQQKFRSHTSYDTDNHDNLFLRLYAEDDAEMMIGKALHLTKLYNYPVKYLMSHFISNLQHLHLQFHSESIFMKYIYNSSRHDVKLSGSNNEIQQLIINDS